MVAAATDAGLEPETFEYTTDTGPGYRRRRAGRGFSYIDSQGRPVRDPDVLARVRSLAIPPAWTDVWICESPAGHLQATGRDSRGRKQYRYHPAWRALRDATKYDRLLTFGERLPALREAVRHDLSRRGLPYEKAVAAVVSLLDATGLRVGNAEYARDNGSYGLTTLKDRHVKINSSEIRFRFRAKGGKFQEVAIRDRRLARVVKRCQDLPGQHLFQFLDDDGQPQALTSTDVNAYIREHAGEHHTAKSFRTWSATVLAAETLRSSALSGAAPTRRQLTEAIEGVASTLGHTPSICRKCYVHPAVVDAYFDGMLADLDEDTSPEDGLDASERYTLALLRRTQADQSRPTAVTKEATVLA